MNAAALKKDPKWIWAQVNGDCKMLLLQLKDESAQNTQRELRNRVKAVPCLCLVHFIRVYTTWDRSLHLWSSADGRRVIAARSLEMQFLEVTTSSKPHTFPTTNSPHHQQPHQQQITQCELLPISLPFVSMSSLCLRQSPTPQGGSAQGAACAVPRCPWRPQNRGRPSPTGTRACLRVGTQRWTARLQCSPARCLFILHRSCASHSALHFGGEPTGSLQ